MNYEQDIPFYTHKFKNYDWNKYESDHYVFNVEKESLAEKNIEMIKERQEKAYLKITEKLKLEKSDQKITYYFYSSQEKKAELMGDSWYGQSIYNEFTIHAVYNEKDKVIGEHEDTHLLSLELGLPISLFQEGLAEYMVGSSMFGNNHNYIIKDGVEKGLHIDIKNLMSQQGWLDTPDEKAEFYYSLAGSFVKYIIETFGLKIFKKIYSTMDRENSREKNIEIFESVTKEKIDNLVDKWYKSIKRKEN